MSLEVIQKRSVKNFLNFYFLILDNKRSREGEREKKTTLICCSTHSCIHWLILVYALTGIKPITLAYQEDSLTN